MAKLFIFVGRKIIVPILQQLTFEKFSWNFILFIALLSFIWNSLLASGFYTLIMRRIKFHLIRFNLSLAVIACRRHTKTRILPIREAHWVSDYFKSSINCILSIFIHVTLVCYSLYTKVEYECEEPIDFRSVDSVAVFQSLVPLKYV